jgi:hypothetical protein
VTSQPYVTGTARSATLGSRPASRRDTEERTAGQHCRQPSGVWPVVRIIGPATLRRQGAGDNAPAQAAFTLRALQGLTGGPEPPHLGELLGCKGFALDIGFAGGFWIHTHGVAGQARHLFHVAEIAAVLEAARQQRATFGSDRKPMLISAPLGLANWAQRKAQFSPPLSAQLSG